MLDFLENKGICVILISMLEYPEGVQRYFYRKDLKLGSRAAYRNHDILYENGLIENIPSKTKLLFKLTEKGEKIAKCLKEMSSIIRN